MVRYRRIYRDLRDAILGGQLVSGSKLPATRAMAEMLGVSRNTVLTAYEQLLAEGYVQGRTGSGTFVSPSLARAPLRDRSKTRRRDERRISRRGKLLGKTRVHVHGNDEEAARLLRLPFVFRPGGPDLQEFPLAVWKR